MSQENYEQGYIDAVKELDEALTRSVTRNEDINKGMARVINDIIARLHHMSAREFDKENKPEVTDESKPQTNPVDEAFERIARIIFEHL